MSSTVLIYIAIPILTSTIFANKALPFASGVCAIMTNDCYTLSPRSAAIGGPISRISADKFLGLESGSEVDSSRSSQDVFVDVEAGFQEESSTDANVLNTTPGVNR